jgi:hypothetical protein
LAVSAPDLAATVDDMIFDDLAFQKTRVNEVLRTAGPSQAAVRLLLRELGARSAALWAEEGRAHEAAWLMLDGNVARFDPSSGLVPHDRRMERYLQVRLLCAGFFTLSFLFFSCPPFI